MTTSRTHHIAIILAGLLSLAAGSNAEEGPGPRETFVRYFEAMEARQSDAAGALKAPECTDTLHMNIHNLDIVARLQPLYELSTPNQALVVAHPFTILSTVLDRDEILYAQFVKLDGAWRIRQISRTSPERASWLMKGFQMHRDVRLDLADDALVGEWKAPCASVIVLDADGTGSEWEVGPAGPVAGEEPAPFTWAINGATLKRRFADRQDQLVVTSIDHRGVSFKTPNKTPWQGWWRAAPKGPAPR